MMRPLWFVSPAGEHFYVAAERDTDGWVVRLFDRNGEQMSPIAFRASYEAVADEMRRPLALEIVADLMNEMRRQIMTREAEFFIQPMRKENSP